MIYYISRTDFHHFIKPMVLKAIDVRDPTQIIDIDVKRGQAGRRLNRKSSKVFISSLVKAAYCSFDKNSVVVISHPLNFWSALFFRASKRAIMYDDGTAYYTNTRIEKSLHVKLLLALAGIKMEDVECYTDLLKYATESAHFFPDLVSENLRSIVKLRNLPISITVSQTLEKGKRRLRSIVVLEPGEKQLSNMDLQRLAFIIESFCATNCIELKYIKGHPTSKKSVLLDAGLLAKNWTSIQHCAFERFLERNQIDVLCCFYSSAAISYRILNKRGLILSLTSKQFQEERRMTEKLFQRLHVTTIEIG